LPKKDIPSSLPRRRESRKAGKDWIPSFAGMTAKRAKHGFLEQAASRVFFGILTDKELLEYWNDGTLEYRSNGVLE
jgi:hypothetical protein